MDVKPPVEVTSPDSTARMFAHLVPEDVERVTKHLVQFLVAPQRVQMQMLGLIRKGRA